MNRFTRSPGSLGADRPVRPGMGGPSLRLNVVVLKTLFKFPNPVNEVTARSVAGLVVLLCIATLIVRSPWLLWALAIGFALRVASGPRFSPFGQLASKVIAPRIGHAKMVPGPPKRFAQTMGLTMAGAAVITYYAGATLASWILVGMILVAAILESAFAICLGCIVFGRLQAIGLIPASVCEACNDIRLARKTGTSAASTAA